MNKKLQEVLFKRREIEKEKKEFYDELNEFKPLKRGVERGFTKEEKEEEIKRVKNYIEDLKKVVYENIEINQKIQRAGFESGIKEMLIELEELKRLKSVLKNLQNKAKMDKVEWSDFETFGFNDKANEVLIFLPLDIKWLKKEIKTLESRIKELDAKIQKLNWEVEVEL